MATLPVIIFPGPAATGNHTTDSGTALSFSIIQPCVAGTMLGVQFWPTGSATTIRSASFHINAGSSTALTLTPVGGAGGGQMASIPLSGNAKNVNTLAVTATDNAGHAKTAQVLFYLRGTMVGSFDDDSDQQSRANKKAPVRKKAARKKK